MTKKKLIKFLKDFPNDAEIYVPSGKILGNVSEAWGCLYDGEHNEIVIVGVDFDFAEEGSIEGPAG